MNVARRFEEAEEHFASGRYQDAANLCRSILDSDPDFAQAYYLMGALFKTTGNFDNAIKFSDLALARAPQDARIYLQKGHALLIIGKREEAEAALIKACELDATQTLAWVLRANINMKSGRVDEALSYLNMALKSADTPDIYEHIGLCQQLKRDLPAAIAAFHQMIERTPDLARGYMNLGKVLLESKRRDEAVKVLQTALEKDPDIYEAHSLLARCAEMAGDADAAIRHGERALALDPKPIGPYVILGGMYVSKARFDEAAKMYAQALAIEPENYLALQGMAKVYLQAGQTEKALEFIEKALAKNPNDIYLQYYRSAIKGEKVEAPRSYVAGLFDEYADRFETHLQQGLRYHTPAEISRVLREVLKEKGTTAKDFSLLDLGCGTGLGAEEVRDLTKFRVGVDLSSKMIDKAKGKNLYDETAVADIVEYMEQTKQRFDLVLCVDTLVYIGDLDPFFKAAKLVTKKGGLLGVSVENGDDAPPYILRASARYSHAKSYLESLAKKYNFRVHQIQLTDLRKNRDQMITGYIALFEA